MRTGGVAESTRAHSVATAAVFLVFAGDVERAATLVRKVSAHTPHHQGWYNFVPFLEAYLARDFEQALADRGRVAARVVRLVLSGRPGVADRLACSACIWRPNHAESSNRLSAREHA